MSDTITTPPPANPMDHFPEEQANYRLKEQRVADAQNAAVVPDAATPVSPNGLLGTF